MAINLSDNIKVKAPKSTDIRYLNVLSQSYANIAEVNSTIPIGERHIGLTVNILNDEYWYESGVADINLVLKGSAADIDNVGAGTGIIYSGSSGSTALLRTLVGSGGTVVETVGAEIRIFSSGETSNLRAVEFANLTISFTATTDSDYISVSGAVTNVYMPLSPPLGQQVTISDDAGNSNAIPITVYGNGKLIDDSATALINTDYGSMTILYNGTFWKVISFSN